MRYENQPVYMIGIAAKLCNVHPQTLRQYERIGLVFPARVGAKNRLYSERDIHRVRRIQRLTQGLGVNLAGVEIILNLRRKIELMQTEVNEFMDYVKREMARGLDDWEQRLGTALVKSSPTDLVRHSPPPAALAAESPEVEAQKPKRKTNS